MAPSLEPASSPATWQFEQVLAVSPSAATSAAAEGLVSGGRWTLLGCDGRAVWGRCSGTSAEPYDCAADHVAARFRCSCASRQVPCKHVVALLLLWVRGRVPESPPELPGVRRRLRPHWLPAWLDAAPVAAEEMSSAPADASLEAGSPDTTASDTTASDTTASDTTAPDTTRPDTVPIGSAAIVPSAAEPAPTVAEGSGPDRVARDERVRATSAGLAEFDRWVHDRIRTGLADPSLAEWSTWEAVAARLVDAKAGGLANRVRRLDRTPRPRDQGRAGLDSTSAESVTGAARAENLLAELAMLHVLADAAHRLETLPDDLADSVALAVGWQVRQADVLAGVPETDTWTVMGRSDTREDRIEVRRTWLRAAGSRRWAMLLSFAAYGQSLDDSLPVGRRLRADVHRYPGALALRALLGRLHDEPPSHANGVDGVDMAHACDEIGLAVAAEPWIERVPVCVRAAPRRLRGGWVLADDTGALSLAVGGDALAVLLACTAETTRPVMCEWTPAGLLPLAVFLDDRAVDIGPVADPSFVAGGVAHLQAAR